MHVFKMKSRRDKIYSIAIPIIVEAFCIDHRVYLIICGKPFAFNIGLSENDAKEPICIACKTNDAHYGLREKIVVKRNRLKCTSKSCIDRCTEFYDVRITSAPINLGFCSLCYHRSILGL